MMNLEINLPSFLKPVSSFDLIRIGRNFDGGYLVQREQIVNRTILVSFGINDDWSFEYDFLSFNRNAVIYLFDKSVSFSQIFKLALKNIFHIPNFYPLFNSFKAIFTYHYFFKKNNVNFFPLFVGRRIQNESKSLIECLEMINLCHKELVVKIDIEGSEYRILGDLIEKKDFIDVCIIEFHDIDLHMNVIEKFVEDFGLYIIHLHVNNYSNPDSNGLPKDIEITFQRHIKIVDNSDTDYPLPIDMPSNWLKKDLKINWV
jgi:hypothetical protein